MIQEDVNQRTVSLSIRSAKLTANVPARALRDFLNAQKKPHNEYAHGKQTLKQLMKQNAGAVNIEVDEGNIKSFDRVARKYRIDYAVKKDKSVDPPKCFVFFKSRDQDGKIETFSGNKAAKVERQEPQGQRGDVRAAYFPSFLRRIVASISFTLSVFVTLGYSSWN